jgi:feruloyl-CoA synthase
MPALRDLLVDASGLSDADVLAHPRVAAALAEKLAAHQREASGSATRVKRILPMTEMLRFEKGEVTDKGSINQRAVLASRAELVEALYAGASGVIQAAKAVA